MAFWRPMEIDRPARARSPSAACAPRRAFPRGRSSCTRGSFRSPARPTSCRSSATSRRCRPTSRSSPAGGRCSSPGRSRSTRPACSPRWPTPLAAAGVPIFADLDLRHRLRAGARARTSSARSKRCTRHRPSRQLDLVRVAVRAGDRLQPRRPRRRPRTRLRHRPRDARRRLPGFDARAGAALLGDRRHGARRGRRVLRRRRPHAHVPHARPPTRAARWTPTARCSRTSARRRRCSTSTRCSTPAGPSRSRRKRSWRWRLPANGGRNTMKSPPKPGVRMSWIALSGDVWST